MAFSCSIGVVTYLGRYESYFKPLIRKLSFLFPDYDINVWINGHYDTKRQIQYLNEITAFLNRYHNIRYLTNYEHQPLAKGFNWLALTAKSNFVLILNDDVKLDLDFRYNIENLHPPSEIFTLNGTWSHFVINKCVIKKVGWFDERLLGIGFEDTDYAIRLALKGIPLENLKIRGLHNCMASPDDAGWAKFPEFTLGKYSILNWEFFQKKWGVVDANEDPEALRITAVGMEWCLKPKATLQDVPEYYPASCLEYAGTHQPNLRERAAGQLARICSFTMSLFKQSRLVLQDRLRELMGPRWGQLKKLLGR